MKKTYMIVTNDIYELPVALDLSGAAAVAEFLGVTVNYVRKSLCNGWSHTVKYKAIVDDTVTVDPAERKREYERQYRQTHNRNAYWAAKQREYRAKRKELKLCKSNYINSQEDAHE